MSKRIQGLIAGLILGIILMTSITAVAANFQALTASFPIFIRGTEFKPENPPVVINGRTYLPLKDTGDALGINVKWNEELSRVDIGEPYVNIETSETPKTIGYSVYDIEYEFFQRMEAGVKDSVLSSGFTYMLHDEKSDEDVMLNGAIGMINSGISALIITPYDSEPLTSVIMEAKKKNIPVVISDICYNESNCDAFIAHDCYKGGQMAADYTKQLLKGREGSKKVAIIKCEPEANIANRRGAGYKDNITAAGFTVVKEVIGYSLYDKGYTVMKDLLSSDPDIVAVFAENDPMAVGAANALADLGRKDVVVIGFNGDQEALEAMEIGILDATIYQDPYAAGRLAVNVAEKLINGETITYDKPDTREIFVPVELITPDNISEYFE